MLGAQTIRTMQEEAAAKAARERRIPFVYWPGDNLTEGGFPFPSLGDYVPDGWTKVDDLFVDSSGFGGDGELALSVSAFTREIERRNADGHARGVTVGYGITSVGQFQVYVGVFEKPY